MPRPPLSADSQRVNLLLPTKMLKALKLVAARQGSPYSEVIREAIRQHITKIADKARADKLARG